MRAVTWNVQTGRPNPDGPPAIERVVEHLRPLAPEVCALQELDRGRARSGGVDQPAVIADGLGGTLLWAPAVRNGGEYGVALIVRSQVVSSRQVDLGGTREPRVLLVAEVDHDGQRWTIGCTHLSRHRDRALQQLAVCLAELSASSGPRVLLGDLNLTRRPVVSVARPAGYTVLDGPATHSTRKRQVRRRIDHVIFAGTTATATAVHRYDISDHCLVEASLQALPRQGA